MGDYELLVDAGDRPTDRGHPRAVRVVPRAAQRLDHRAGPRSPRSRRCSRSTTPYPAVEVRAPGDTRVPARERSGDPADLLLKEQFGEFTAHPDTTDPGRTRDRPDWVQDHIQSATLPVLGIVTCNADADLAAEARDARGSSPRVSRARSPTSARASTRSHRPTTRSARSPRPRGARRSSSTRRRTRRVTRPTSPRRSCSRCTRWGFGWAGNDAYPQGALFRYRTVTAARD